MARKNTSDDEVIVAEATEPIEAAAEATENVAADVPETELGTDIGDTNLPSDGILDPDESLLSEIVDGESLDATEASADDGGSSMAFSEDAPEESFAEDAQEEDAGADADADGNSPAETGAAQGDSDSVETENAETPSDADEATSEGASAPDDAATPDKAASEEATSDEAAAGETTARRVRNGRGRPTRDRQTASLSPRTIASVRQRREDNQARFQRVDNQERRVAQSENWSGLQNAMRNGQILHGKISGVRTINESPYVVIMYGGTYLVLIPYQAFYVADPIDMRQVTLNNRDDRINLRQRQVAILEKHYGYDTPFIVTRMERGEEGSYVILGSRAAAINRRAHENFTLTNSGDAVMKAGDIVPAVVTSVAEHSIAVNVGGVDTRIRASDLTFRYVPSGEKILEMFAVNDTIPVMLMDAEKDRNGHWNCRVSRRRVEMEEAKSRHHLFCNRGDLTSAVVTGKYFSERTGRAYLRLYLDSYDLPASASTVPRRPNGEYPAIGESYRVSYSGYNEETGMTYVTLRGYHGPARL